MERYIIVERYADNGELSHRALVDSADGRELGTDGGEPEDQSFWRDWAWVPDELNRQQATIAALQARVQDLEQWVQDQSTANLETMRHMDEMQSRAMDAEQQLTQRTAELEAIEKILDIDSGKTTVEKVRDLHHSFKQVWESYQDASNEMFKAQAELERVRLLIKALPKVEGEVTVRDITALCWANDGTYGSINCKEQLVSLLQERQKLC